jgi:endonuclease-3
MNKSTRIIKILEILKKQQANTMLGDMSRKYDAFKILISTILSARSKDETTYPICEELFKKYPNASKLANAKAKDVEKMIKKIGFYKQKTKYIINTANSIIQDYKGRVPKTMKELTSFHGVGNKVAACVMVYAHGLEEIPVDIHVAVISRRVGLTKHTNPDKIMEDLKKITPKNYWMLVNDLLVWHGKEVCDTRKPKCYMCKIRHLCIYKNKTIKH